MKKARMGFLALAAIIGITSAFTTKGNAKTGTSRTYGVLNLTSGGLHYKVQVFAGSCSGQVNTCSVKFTSTAAVTVITKSLAHSIVRGNYTPLP